MCSRLYPYIRVERLGVWIFFVIWLKVRCPEENVATDEEVKQTLPSPQEAKPNTIYYVLQNNAGAGNQYIEYILINGALEAIGYGNADLSGYVTEDYVAKADDALMEDIFNQLSPIQEKYLGTGNLVAFLGLYEGPAQRDGGGTE